MLSVNKSIPFSVLEIPGGLYTKVLRSAPLRVPLLQLYKAPNPWPITLVSNTLGEKSCTHNIATFVADMYNSMWVHSW